MGDNSRIGWTNATWNCIIGCSRVGDPDEDGCAGCYAIGQVARGMSIQHRGMTVKVDGERVDWTGEVRYVPHLVDQPWRWRSKPRMIFVNSLSDLFHPNLANQVHVPLDADGRPGAPYRVLARIVAEMVRCPMHTFQVLTKRPRLMADTLGEPAFRRQVHEQLQILGHPGLPPEMLTGFQAPWPLHIWWGTSIERDKYVFRANHLRRIQGVRWISAEPLLEPLPSLDITGISWVVVGGESGGRARPMHPDWARDLRDRCADRWHPAYDSELGGSVLELLDKPRAAFFFKQWGSWWPNGQTLPEDVDPKSAKKLVSVRGTTITRAELDAQMAALGAGQDTSAWDVRNGDELTGIHRIAKDAEGHDVLDGRHHHEYPDPQGALR